MLKKHIYYVDVIVEVPVTLKVLAVDEQEAFARTNDGGWHGVMNEIWDRVKVKSVGTFTKGPEVN